MRSTLPILLLVAAVFDLAAVESRLSGVVSFTTTAAGSAAWLRSPGVAFMQAWVRFPSELSPSTIFGIDQEMLDGVANPHFVANGDWMGFTGVTRSGWLWVAVGTASTMAGTPSSSRTWQILPIGQALQPDTWYCLRNVVDFSQRRFVGFRITGPGIDRSFDLSAYALDYPNAMPFDERAMTRYVWSMDGTGLGGSATAPSAVFFDDISYGYLASATAAAAADQMVVDDCETGTEAIPSQPLPPAGTIPYVIPVSGYAEGAWYLERSEALAARLRTSFARSGNGVLVCDGSLAAATYAGWLGTARVAYNAAPSASSQQVQVAAGSAAPFILTGSDADGQALTYAIIASPVHGMLAGSPPALSYRPDDGFTGSDQMVFTAADGIATSAPATVSFAVAPPSGGASTDGSGGGGGGGCASGIAAAIVLLAAALRAVTLTTALPASAHAAAAAASRRRISCPARTMARNPAVGT